jgi:hypothetical protein
MLRFAPVDLDIVIEHLTTFSNCPCQALPDVGTSTCTTLKTKICLLQYPERSDDETYSLKRMRTACEASEPYNAMVNKLLTQSSTRKII